ncbi:MAG TPA: hypothetical protein DEA08_25335 [Planctomycetes bacterium]|nr:hypothetical protein [Planctomycetota bacterium]
MTKAEESPKSEPESPKSEPESEGATSEGATSEGATSETEGSAVGAPVGSGTPTELKAPPPVAGNESPEPAVVALVFLLPPLALGGTALGLLLAGGYGWNPLGVGLMVGLVASVVGFAVIRRIFDKG